MFLEHVAGEGKTCAYGLLVFYCGPSKNHHPGPQHGAMHEQAASKKDNLIS